MGKISKRTRKFQAKHLGGAIKHRRVHQRKKQQEADRASKRPADAPSSDDDEQQKQPRKQLEDMSIDEFLNGGFLEAEGTGGAQAGPSDEESDEDASLSGSDADLDGSSEEEDEEEGARPATQKAVKQHKQMAPAAAAAAGRKREQQETASESEDEQEGSEEEGSEEGMSGDEDEEDGEGEEGGSEDDVAVTSSSDDEGEDGAPRSKLELKAEMAAHKAQLEALRKQDPEFYAYLKSTDQELLNFGKDSDDEMDSEGEEGQEEEEGSGDEPEEEPAVAAGAGKGKQGAAGAKEKPGVRLAMVDGWCAAAREKAGLGAVRNIMKAYRVACHYGDSEEQVEESMRIASSAVYNKLMLFVLKEVDGIFRRMLLEDANAKQQAAPLTAAALVRLPRLRKVEPMVKSYLGNTLHLLGALTDSAMLTFILRRLRASTVMLAPYEKLQRRLLKAALGLFGSADNAPRVQAVLLVRQMALELPQPALDNCLKGVYRAYSANSKFVNTTSMPQINFMAAAVVEMYGINASASYQHAFSFIRQLAVLLRSALTNKSKEAYREVYCWQTINCLELWAKLLAAKADEPELRPLIYPVTQLLLGVARLVPAPAYFPLRLRCARALNRLGQATSTFIPVAPLLLEMLQWGDLRRAPKPGPGQHPDVLLQLRVSKAAMRSSQYQEEIISQLMELLAEHLACWGCHIAFPELSFLTVTQLRKFMKATPVDRFRKQARQLVEAVEKNTTFVGRARDQVDFCPKDLAQVANFLGKESAAQQAPIQQYARSLLDRARQRLQMRLADEVELGSGPTAGAGDDSDEGEDPTGSLLPKYKQKQRQAAAEDEEGGTPAAKRQKKAAQQQKQQQQQQQAVEDSSDEEMSGGSEGEEEDAVVWPYELSDEDDEANGHGAPDFEASDEEDEDDESGGDEPPRKQQQQQPGRSGRGGRGGGGRGGGRGRGGRDGGRGGGGRGRDGGRSGGGHGGGRGQHSQGRGFGGRGGGRRGRGGRGGRGGGRGRH